MGMCGGGDGGAAKEARRLEEQRQANIAQGNIAIERQFSGFDDNFYANRAKDYESFALPRLEKEFGNTKRNLTYSLARSGLMGSSVDSEKNANLADERQQQLRNVADVGQGQANELRQQIEGQRSNLTSQLEASADPGAATNLALRTAQAYAKPTSYAPIGNFFKEWTGNFIANNEARQYDPNVAPLFGWGGETQRMVNR
jgi:hypothetical protein